MAKVAVQVTEAVAQVKEREEKTDHITPVEKEHDKERGRESRELNVTPDQLGLAPLL